MAMGDDDSSGPLQIGAVLIGALAIGFIVVNAAFLQSDRHPAPIFQTRLHGAIVQKDAPVKSTDRFFAGPSDETPGKVQEIQTRLQRLGYDVGDVDGVFGARTQSAIMDFQRDRGYPQTGKVTPLLVKRLNRPAPKIAPIPPANPAAKPESRLDADTSLASPPPQPADIGGRVHAEKPADKEEILLVQRALSDLGYGPIEIDGVLGGQTGQAIQRFELDRGLPITGKLGERIIAELVLIGGVKPIANR